MRENRESSEPLARNPTPLPSSARSSTSTRSPPTTASSRGRVGTAAGLRGRQGGRLRARRGRRSRGGWRGRAPTGSPSPTSRRASRCAARASRGEVLLLSHAEPEELPRQRGLRPDARALRRRRRPRPSPRPPGPGASRSRVAPRARHGHGPRRHPARGARPRSIGILRRVARGSRSPGTFANLSSADDPASPETGAAGRGPRRGRRAPARRRRRAGPGARRQLRRDPRRAAEPGSTPCGPASPSTASRRRRRARRRRARARRCRSRRASSSVRPRSRRDAARLRRALRDVARVDRSPCCPSAIMTASGAASPDESRSFCAGCGRPWWERSAWTSLWSTRPAPVSSAATAAVCLGPRRRRDGDGLGPRARRRDDPLRDPVRHRSARRAGAHGGPRVIVRALESVGRW